MPFDGAVPEEDAELKGGIRSLVPASNVESPVPETLDCDEVREVEDVTGVDELPTNGAAIKGPIGAPSVDDVVVGEKRDVLLEKEVEVDNEVLERLPLCV